MQELKVNAKMVQVSQKVLEQRMIEDIREMDMDSLTDLFQYMYPVKVDDVQGMEGEEVIVKVDENQMSGGDLNDIFG